MGSDLVYSVCLRMERCDPRRQGSWTVARLFRGIDLCRSGLWRRQDLWRTGSGHEDSSHNILTLDALLAGLSSQVTPGLSMSMRIRRYVKSTYIHTPGRCVQLGRAVGSGEPESY
jgi:hypothetical protein